MFRPWSFHAPAFVGTAELQFGVDPPQYRELSGTLGSGLPGISRLAWTEPCCSMPWAVVAEDDCLQSALAATLLEVAGFEVAECGNAAEALAAIKRKAARVFLVSPISIWGANSGALALMYAFNEFRTATYDEVSYR